MAHRILLVDDDIAEISAVKLALHQAGIQTTLATNSADALATIHEAAPEAVVLAPGCENGDGAALARELARQIGTRHIPLILLGAGDMDGIVAEVVPRPIQSVALERAVWAALGRKATAAPAPLPDARLAAAELCIREKLELVRRANYFAILGLGRSCTGHEVREASERLLSDLKVERFDPVTPGLAADVREIRRVLEEARDVLSDDALRAEYRASLGD